MEFKVGQEVLYCSGGALSIYRLYKVDKITPKGFIRVKSTLYEDRGDGTARARGQWDWGAPTITNNPLKIIDYKQQLFIKKVKENVNRSKLTFEQAKKINDVLKEVEEDAE